MVMGPHRGEEVCWVLHVAEDVLHRGVTVDGACVLRTSHHGPSVSAPASDGRGLSVSGPGPRCEPAIGTALEQAARPLAILRTRYLDEGAEGAEGTETLPLTTPSARAVPAA